MLKFNVLKDFVNKIYIINKAGITTEGGSSQKSPSKPAEGHQLDAQTEGTAVNDYRLSTTHLIQAAENITKSMLNTAARPPWGLPTKYFAYAKKLSAYKDYQTYGASRSEGKFASLLLHDIFRDTHTYYKWRGLLEWVYAKSLGGIGLIG